MTPSVSRSIAQVASPTRRWWQNLLLVLVGTAVLAMSSYIVVPMWPVPISMQTFAVLMVGALYGWRLGGITVVAWLLQALAGMPVLAGGTGGLASFMGPTAGYIFAFPAGAMLMGYLAARGWDGQRPVRAFFAMLFCTTFILLVGGAWLSVLFGLEKGWQLGVFPFLIGDVVKSALGAASLVVWQSVFVKKLVRG